MYIPKIIVFCLFYCVSAFAYAEPITNIQNTGDSANRVDIVVLGDGYTAGEISSGKYANDVDTAITNIFNQEPFKEYKAFFNIHRIDVTSVDSGISKPGSPKNTALDAFYNCANTRRLICLSASGNTTARNIVTNSVDANQQDIQLVIVNDSEYGGSGGFRAVFSTHPAASDIALHELGHSFGRLADEYSLGTCTTTLEPSEVNVTLQTQRNLIKWNASGGPPNGWIEFDTQIPTTGNTSTLIPGLYIGGKYCTSGVYRATYDSKMRSLNRPFNQIGQEQLIKRIYNIVSPIDRVTPLTTTLVLREGESRTFSVISPVIDAGNRSFTTTWDIDGEIVGSGTDFTVLNQNQYADGLHTLKVVVHDPTPKIRNHTAPEESTESFKWEIDFQSIITEIVSPANNSQFTASAVTFKWTIASDATTAWLYVGSRLGGQDILNSRIGINTTAYILANLPEDGQVIYVRFWTRQAGAWSFVDYNYIANSPPT
ncbi:hypothetical protein MNBD_GAMMA13-262 [hydrothermal vent metagenome]|uniref:Uncharacterized protein n=1 Tax=hydrothermal vent metagenome TaxID=652676 RepID=A0A3B0YP55_9ZZZZ